MNTQERIEQHERAIEILERVDSIEQSIKNAKEFIVALKGLFPKLESEQYYFINKANKRIKFLLENLPKFENYV